MIKPTFEVKGLTDITTDLNKTLESIEDHTSEGLEMAGQFIIGESKDLTSIDEGNLIRTPFAQLSDTGNSVAVGYTADYAAAAHEMPDDTNWNRPGAENKFLEKAISRNLGKIFNIIANLASKSPRS